MEPEPRGTDSFNLGIEKGVVPVGENVKVVQGGGTAAQEQLDGGNGRSTTKVLGGS